jgi:HlyD family secretion protein
MDIPRKSQARKRRILRSIYVVITLGAVGGITYAVWNMKPAAPPVERTTVWISTVKRGPMLRQVRGPGTLVPEEIRWVPAVTSGRVEKKLVQPGAQVKSDTVLLELSNPQLEQEVLNAQWDFKAAESNYTDLKVRLEDQALNKEADAVDLQSRYNIKKLEAEVQESLLKLGLVSDLQVRQVKVEAEQLSSRIDFEKRRLEKSQESIAAQLAVQKTRVDQLRAVYDLKRSQMDQLKVRAGVPGVLQLMQVEVGEQVSAGAKLARVANPTRLKAELKIMETQAKDVQIGQVASIDTRNGIIQGHVIRKDPSVVQATVTVDVALEGDLPPGAVPDLSVDGTIELERLNDVVYVERPTQGQEGSTIGLFRLTPDGREAERVQVKIGRVSVSTVEILSGLKPGDQVILSDMSAQDAFDRIRLN